MAGELRTWTPAQFRTHEVLVAHQRQDESCTCGADGITLGQYAGHVVNELTAAGVIIHEPVQHGTVDQLVRDADEGRV